MAYTKIYPVKKHLYQAINYITQESKTENIYISSSNTSINPNLAFKEFEIVSNNARKVKKSFEKNKNLSYKEWLVEQGKEPTHRQILKSDIDSLLVKVNSFEELLSELRNKGYEIKKGKHISFSQKGWDRFIRSKSIDNEGNYTEENLRKQISEPNKNNSKLFDSNHENINQENKNTHKEKIKAVQHLEILQKNIDTLVIKVGTMKELFNELNKIGYEIQRDKQQLIIKPSNQNQFFRLKALGENYTEENLKTRINEKFRLYDIKPKSEKTNTNNYKDNLKILKPTPLTMHIAKQNLNLMKESDLLFDSRDIKNSGDLENYIKNLKSNIGLLEEDKNKFFDKFKKYDTLLYYLEHKEKNINIIEKYNELKENKKNTFDFYSKHKEVLDTYFSYTKFIKQDFNNQTLTYQEVKVTVTELKNMLDDKFTELKETQQELILFQKTKNKLIKMQEDRVIDLKKYQEKKKDDLNL